MSNSIVYRLCWRYGWYGRFATSIALFYLSLACKYGLIDANTAIDLTGMIASRMVRMERAE